LQGSDAPVLAKLLIDSETLAENVARSVADMVRDYSRENTTVVTRGNLADHVEDIGKRLVEKLQPQLEGVSPDVVHNALKRAVGKNP
jgi:hypothetical protein